MKKLLLTIFLLPILIFSQIQIGQDIDGEAANDQSGSSVSLSADGNIVAIGAFTNGGDNGSASGHVRVYTNQGGTWTQIGADIDGEAAIDQSGFSVSLSADGNIVAIGAFYNDGNGNNSGHVRVYTNQGGTWTQIGVDIDGEAANDLSGRSVSISSDGNIVAIGAHSNDGNGTNSGHVRVYTNQGGTWTQIGADIDGKKGFGWSVSLSGDGNVVAIGADDEYARVYTNQGGTWTQIGTDIIGEALFDSFGYYVSLSTDGGVVAIGAIYNDGNGSASGHVRVYTNQGGVWTQIGTDIDGEAEGDQSGFSVSLSADGNIVAIGAFINDGNGSSSGHVRVYTNMLGTWTQIGTDIDGEAFGDGSGFSVSLSADGSVLAIGANGNNGGGSRSGHVRVYDLSALLSSNDFVLSEFSLYPNPVKEHFTIQLSQSLELQKVNIYNSLGQFISSTTKRIVDTTGLSSGMYYIEVITNQGKATKKIVVE